MITLCKSASAILGLAALTAATLPAHAQTAYAIANGGDTLISFDVNSPGTVTTIGTFSGGSAFLEGLDFRPATGQLYGYSDRAGSLYTVNTSTGALTPVGAAALGLTNTFNLGMDFNPTIDRLRIVTDSAQNIVLNPNSAAVTFNMSNLAYGATDVNANTSPSIIDNAYSNNIAGTGAGTTQYVIDYGADILATLNNNGGVLTTVGALGVDTDNFTGFDIFSATATSNAAYALLTPAGGSAGLYSINLGTGAATLLGGLGATLPQVYSLAIVPTQVPEPGSVALLLGAGAFGVSLMRRRNRK